LCGHGEDIDGVGLSIIMTRVEHHRRKRMVCVSLAAKNRTGSLFCDDWRPRVKDECCCDLAQTQRRLSDGVYEQMALRMGLLMISDTKTIPRFIFGLHLRTWST
jgi:hypothetical protein